MVTHSDATDSDLSMNSHSQKDLDYAHAMILKLKKNPAIDPQFGMTYLTNNKVDIFFDALPQIKKDGTNFISWMGQIQRAIDTFAWFRLLEKDVDIEKCDPTSQCIADAMEAILSPKIDKTLDDRAFAESINHQPCMMRIESIERKYTVREHDKVKSEIRKGIKEAKLTRNFKSIKELYESRAEHAEYLSTIPRVAPFIFPFAEFYHYKMRHGEYPFSHAMFLNRIIRESKDMTPEEVKCSETIQRKIANSFRDFSSQDELFTRRP